MAVMEGPNLLYACPKCKMVYEIERHHVRPPAEPHCEPCQQPLPVADGDAWLTYTSVRCRPPASPN